MDGLWSVINPTPEDVQRRLYVLEDFVEMLRRKGFEIPTCWHAHEWICDRLIALAERLEKVADEAEMLRWWEQLDHVVCLPMWREALRHGVEHSDPETGEVRRIEPPEIVKPAQAA